MSKETQPAGEVGLPERREAYEFDWHEALDRAALFAHLVDSQLLNLAAVQSASDVRAKIEAAAEALAEAYQMIGRKRFDLSTPRQMAHE